MARIDEKLGFKKIAKKNYSNIDTDWIQIEIKIIKHKIFLLLNDKPIFVGIEEPDGALITKIHGTFMLGINGAKVEFSDIVFSAVKKPVDESTPAEGEEGEGAEGEGGGGSDAAAGDAADAAERMDDEEEIDEDELADPSDLESETIDPSAVCKSKTTCKDRGAWCTLT